MRFFTLVPVLAILAGVSGAVETGPTPGTGFYWCVNGGSGHSCMEQMPPGVCNEWFAGYRHTGYGLTEGHDWFYPCEAGEDVPTERATPVEEHVVETPARVASWDGDVLRYADTGEEARLDWWCHNFLGGGHGCTSRLPPGTCDEWISASSHTGSGNMQGHDTYVECERATPVGRAGR